MKIHTEDNLINIINATERPIGFLVGAPLSNDGKGKGVPGVAGMIELAREWILSSKVADKIADFDTKIKSAEGADAYQEAIGWLSKNTGPDSINKIVQEAVYKARKNSDSVRDGGGDGSPDHWFLPPGTIDLARLIHELPEKFSGPIITTNFDPLLKLALEKVRRGVATFEVLSDSDIQMVTTAPDTTDVIYLHGYWRESDSFHTTAQLQSPRLRLVASLKKVLQTHTLLVVAYGGWDDAFMRALSELALDDQSHPDVLWCFREADESVIRSEKKDFFEQLEDVIRRGRFRAFKGIDCHSIFRTIAGSLPSRVSSPGPVRSPQLSKEEHSHLKRVIAQWKKETAAEKFIDVVDQDRGGAGPQSLETTLDSAFNDRDATPCRFLLLGNYGTGKTTFLKYYAQLLATRRLNDPSFELIPVFVDLKLCTAFNKAEGQITSAFKRCHPAFDPDGDNHRFILLLDSFDEMGMATARKDIQRNQRTIRGIITQFSVSAIVACRPHFFETAEFDSRFPDFQVSYIRQWSKKQVKSYVENSIPKDPSDLLLKISELFNLKQLARTPLFLEMIVEAESELKGMKTAVDLYDFHIDRKLKNEGFAYFEVEEMKHALEKLAWYMLTNRIGAIGLDVLGKLFRKSSGKPLKKLIHSIRAKSFLIMDAASEKYVFSHRSLMEFLAAASLAKAITKGDAPLRKFSEIELPKEIVFFLAAKLENEIDVYIRLHHWLDQKDQQKFAIARRNIANTLIQVHGLRSNTSVDESQFSKETGIANDEKQSTKSRREALIKLSWMLHGQGDVSGERLSSFHQILENEKEAVPGLLRYAIVLLGLLGDFSSTERFFDLMKNYGREGYEGLQAKLGHKIRQNCAVALAFMLNREATVPDSAGESPSPLREKVILELQLAVTSDPHGDVRRSIIWAMEKIDSKAFRFRKEIIDRAKHDKREDVRQYATLTIGSWADPGDIEILGKLSRDTSKLVKIAALNGLDNFHDEEGAQNHVKLLLDDDDDEVRIAAKRAIDAI